MVFGETTGEKVFCVMTVVLSWLIMGNAMRSRKLGYAVIFRIVGSFAVILYILYLSLEIHGS